MVASFLIFRPLGELRAWGMLILRFARPLRGRFQIKLVQATCLPQTNLACFLLRSFYHWFHHAAAAEFGWGTLALMLMKQ